MQKNKKVLFTEEERQKKDNFDRGFIGKAADFVKKKIDYEVEQEKRRRSIYDEAYMQAERGEIKSLAKHRAKEHYKALHKRKAFGANVW